MHDAINNKEDSESSDEENAWVDECCDGNNPGCVKEKTCQTMTKG
jgi:hypothetical protein